MMIVKGMRKFILLKIRILYVKKNNSENRDFVKEI